MNHKLVNKHLLFASFPFIEFINKELSENTIYHFFCFLILQQFTILTNKILNYNNNSFYLVSK